MPTPTVDARSFWTYGYTIVRNVYSADEITALREAALASRHRGPGDLLSNPSMRHVLTDGRLVDIARRILSRDDILYYGDSSFTIKPGTPGYHKDNADRTDPLAPDWRNDPYTQLRFGVYCQDHWRHSGGLNLRSKSHTTVSLTHGKTVYLRTRVGDVGVWSLRTSHSGGGTLLKFPRWVHPEPTGGRRYPAFLVAKPHPERVSVFAALGADDEHAARYVDYLKTRTYMVNSFRNSVYDDDALAEAAKVGLRVRDLRREVEGDDTVGRNEKWVALPY
ncbi:MAG TPA: hypothetical protein VES42_25555 [Pilimelia sp.]|nr:hypothetical protein [Pilimelia sp.]